ncbi:MAG: alkaline phosphatase family protein [Cellvibrionaceae bacterium]|nr:alkaline phosphatase family protein [Cellvibrionaceae bacterium]
MSTAKFLTYCVLLLCIAAAEHSSAELPKRILFGSCSHQDSELAILDAINAEHPDLFIMLGDNIYGDTEDMKELAAKYQKLGAKPRFQTLRQQSQLIAIWDDHDYGKNDAGAEYPKKAESKQIMLDFFGEPSNSPRRQRSDGNYTAYFFGEGEQSVHIILPDLRWNRDPLPKVNVFWNWLYRVRKDMGPYRPADASASMLGQKQWQWLQQELKKPAKLKIIASSLQLLPEFTGWESWANYPGDRQRLLNFIAEQKIEGVLFISGDTHWGEISRLQHSYPLWEITSSGLSEEWKQISPNKHRQGKAFSKVNYGFIDIDWQGQQLQFGLKSETGQVLARQQYPFSALSVPNNRSPL